MNAKNCIMIFCNLMEEKKSVLLVSLSKRLIMLFTVVILFRAHYTMIVLEAQCIDSGNGWDLWEIEYCRWLQARLLKDIRINNCILVASWLFCWLTSLYSLVLSTLFVAIQIMHQQAQKAMLLNNSRTALFGRACVVWTWRASSVLLMTYYLFLDLVFTLRRLQWA